MIIPGFTAEASVYRTTQSYRATTGGSLGLTASSVTPQLNCSSKCTAEYTACLAGCLFAGGACIPGCFLAFGLCQDGCGSGGGSGGPGPNPRCGCPAGTVCKADASRSQASALSATGIVLAPGRLS